MKFGSVRFYKRLIVITVLVLLVVSIALAILFGVLYAGQKKRADQLAIELATTPAASQQPAGADPATGPAPQAPSELEYQNLYPNLYATPPEAYTAESMVCYLTFDDGPSDVTAGILDTLDRYEIKATFFVTGEASVTDEDVLRDAAQRGHTIGVHSYSHDYNTIYTSVEAYLADFEAMYSRIVEVTGDAPTLFRFPGGSTNVYNVDTRDEIIAEMERRGFTFFDWNAAGNDAVAGGISAAEVASNALGSSGGRERVVILLHDRPDNATTAEALPAIIEGMWERGYRFEPLADTVEPVTYYYGVDD